MPIIGKFIYGLYSSKNRVESLQQQIRDVEWKAIEGFIPQGSRFMDVGCGAGYAMQRAQLEKNCSVVGIDPEPGAHGVGRFEAERVSVQLDIQQGYSEQLPFEDNRFDIVYSSHVLEHVAEESKTLQEMKRVLKPGGILIIGMPTASMALINGFSQLLFTTHVKIYEFLRFLHKKGRWKRLVAIFRIYSHSAPRATSIWYDLLHYRSANWKRLVQSEFEIQEEIYPILYPYPDYKQIFRPRRFKRFGSSVFFICRMKKKL